jgi:hypothetical protein
MNGSRVGAAPCNIASKRRKAISHIDLIRRARLHDANGGKGLQPVTSAETLGRRVIGHDIAFRKAAQQRRLSVTDLHEAAGAPDPHMRR